MARPVTLFTGQWADLPLETLAAKAEQWGYDGLELICLGDHLDPEKAAVDKAYCQRQLDILGRHHLKLFAINNAIAGQLVCDPNADARSDKFAPPACAGDPEHKRAWAVEAMKATARAARNLGVRTVAGFTGSSIWHLFYSFPPVPDDDDRGRVPLSSPSCGTPSSTSSTSAASVSPSRSTRRRSPSTSSRPGGPWRPWTAAGPSASTSTPAIFTGRWSIRCCS